MATYGASVSLALTGDTITGKGFTTYIERFMPGVIITKLDVSLAPNEFTVSIQPQSSSSPGVWGISAYKVINPPPPRLPGTYVVALITRNGVPEDHDFDITVSTFR